MPWKETTQVQARVRFIEDWLAKEYESLAVLCRVHGVSRKTGYKWVGRFREGGRPGLNDQSRRWRSQPLGDVFVYGTINDHGWRACQGVNESFSKAPDGRIVGDSG